MNPTFEDLRETLIGRIYNFLGCTEERSKVIIDLMLEDVKLFDRKQRDYGEHNISKFGEFGVLVRSSDKIERLTNLHQRGTLPNNESIEDTWRDLSIYATIARAIHQGSW